MIYFIGYVFAILIGAVLGLIGAGGSLIAVPVFVYIFGISASVATGYSLLVLGVASYIGASKYILQKQIDFKAGIIFIIPASISILVMRMSIMPIVPECIFGLEKGSFIMIFFSMILIISSLFVFKPIRESKKKQMIN